MHLPVLRSPRGVAKQIETFALTRRQGSAVGKLSHFVEMHVCLVAISFAVINFICQKGKSCPRATRHRIAAAKAG